MDYCRTCDKCAARKPSRKINRTPLGQYIVGEPMEKVALDVLGPLQSVAKVYSEQSTCLAEAITPTGSSTMPRKKIDHTSQEQAIVKTDSTEYTYEPTIIVKQEPQDFFSGCGLPTCSEVVKPTVKKKKLKQEKITDYVTVKKKKRDRFNGTPEEDVLKMLLPDHLAPDLDIVIVGINPGLAAAYIGHHYAGPGNHFWKCMYLSGLIPEPMTAYDDYKLLTYGIGFTNIVGRTTRGSAELTRKEIKEGAQILIDKLKKYKPKIAVFNGKGIYEVFCGHKNFSFGKQPDTLDGSDIVVYVMPSSSARCSQLPRAVDKVPFYQALKKLKDYITGVIDTLDDSEVCFPDLELKTAVKSEKKSVKSESVDIESLDNDFMQSYEIMNHDGNNYNHLYSQGNFDFNFANITAVKQESPFEPSEYGQSCSYQPLSRSILLPSQPVSQSSSMLGVNQTGIQANYYNSNCSFSSHEQLTASATTNYQSQVPPPSNFATGQICQVLFQGQNYPNYQSTVPQYSQYLASQTGTNHQNDEASPYFDQSKAGC
ncbi:hypothetical protein CHS0354_016110 [Potamilus streckersoni]|uniref:G/T mismatch-specific thymine DNA glycosylase n=1 Tax=Potamilus streckersoni TaxID=2493646 RepID=A0AAE0T0X1_9BIVA|nr:hypothetical protein CHS0354_016110 [Potamilus streckersoni]